MDEGGWVCVADLVSLGIFLPVFFAFFWPCLSDGGVDFGFWVLGLEFTCCCSRYFLWVRTGRFLGW